MFSFFYKLWGKMGFLPFLQALEPMPQALLQQAINKETLRLARVISLVLSVFYCILVMLYTFVIESEAAQSLLTANIVSIILLTIFFACTYLPFTLRYAIPLSVIAALIPFTNTLHRLYVLEEITITISIIIGILALATIALESIWLFCLITYTYIVWLVVVHQLAFPIDFTLIYYAVALPSSGIIAIFICRMRYRTIRNYNHLRWHETLQRKSLERAQEDLKEQHAELAHVDELKSTFLGSMSHELRTPLTAINGFAEVLQAENFGPLNEKQKDYLNNISVSGKQLLDLVNNILTLSSFDANQVPIKLDLNPISEIVQTALSVLEQVIEQKNIDIVVSLEAEDTAYFDSVIINQVMLNLLGNAIKFSDENSVIEIKSYDLDEKTVIEVIDSAMGISEENQSLLFLPFSQVDNSFNRSHQGAGLGLALCKRMVTEHGGSIFVKSELGKGSTFGFSLLKEPPELIKEEKHLPVQQVEQTQQDFVS